MLWQLSLLRQEAATPVAVTVLVGSYSMRAGVSIGGQSALSISGVQPQGQSLSSARFSNHHPPAPSTTRHFCSLTELQWYLMFCLVPMLCRVTETPHKFRQVTSIKDSRVLSHRGAIYRGFERHIHALTGLPGSRKATSATPQGVSAWPSSTGSQPSSADASYIKSLPSSATAPLNTGGGDSLLRATANQCFTRGWLGTYTCGRSRLWHLTSKYVPVSNTLFGSSHQTEDRPCIA